MELSCSTRFVEIKLKQNLVKLFLMENKVAHFSPRSADSVVGITKTGGGKLLYIKNFQSVISKESTPKTVQ